MLIQDVNNRQRVCRFFEALVLILAIILGPVWVEG